MVAARKMALPTIYSPRSRVTDEITRIVGTAPHLGRLSQSQIRRHGPKLAESSVAGTLAWVV
jgi:hypothetical protein